MQTTKGKTRPPKRPSRSVRIHSMPSGNRVEVRYASTLKQGLEDFFTEYLKPKGFLNKKIVGNMMMVQRGKGAKEYTFVAYEEAPPKAKR